MTKSTLAAFAFAFIVLATGCGKSLDARPTVLVDEDFGSELPEVLAGLDSWQGVVPSITLAPHAELIKLPAMPDTVLVIATHGQADCPGPHLMDPGTTSVSHDVGSAVSCLDVDYIREHGGFTRAAGHEMGHALGLAHDHAPSSLMLNAYAGAAAPSCEDYSELTQVLGTDTPKECR